MPVIHQVRLKSQGITLEAAEGRILQDVLAQAGLSGSAYCGGQGKCGKCRVKVNGQEVLACHTRISDDLEVDLPFREKLRILDDSSAAIEKCGKGCFAAFDVGTTTVVGYLLDETGRVLASLGQQNPQSSYGADVISRIRAAELNGSLNLSVLIRNCVSDILFCLLDMTGTSPDRINRIAVAGNPAMEQLFLGLPVDNLISIPFVPVLKKPEVFRTGDYLRCCERSELRVLPNISGYVGGDTIGCILSSGMDETEELTLMIDIGTNGEMVLGNRQSMLCCATAAGPALEGASISCGMRGQSGAIDHVILKDGVLSCSVIDEDQPRGICGSGLIDAVAAFLSLGQLDKRGRILPLGETRLELFPGISLTQEDIRQLQLAKGAIAAGIQLLCEELGCDYSQIQKVYLAGAFGSYLSPESACRIGLIPPILEDRIRVIGNAAGKGAILCASNDEVFHRSGVLASSVRAVDLASVPSFNRRFAENMYFQQKERCSPC